MTRHKKFSTFLVVVFCLIQSIKCQIDGNCYIKAMNLTSLLIQWEYCGSKDTFMDNFHRMDRDNNSVIDNYEYYTNCGKSGEEWLYCFFDIDRKSRSFLKEI